MINSQLDFKKISSVCLKFCLLFFVVQPANAADSAELLRASKTWQGGDIVYPEGSPVITSVKLKIAEGEATPFHCHPVPTLGYILKGKVEVETKSGRKTVFSEGESAVEVLRTLHRGRAIEGPVEIIVFYVGASEIPHTVLPEDDPDARYCDR